MTPDPLLVFTAAVREHLEKANAELRRAVDGLDTSVLDATLGPDTSSLAVLVAHTVETTTSILHSVIGEPLPRDREAAFRTAGLAAADLVDRIDASDAELVELLARLTLDDLARPVERYRIAPGAWWVLQTLGHVREHGAQASLTRQILLNREAQAGG
jgi:DinB superfamily